MGILFRLRLVSFMPWHFNSNDSSYQGGILKDATVGFVSNQTACYLLWVAFCRHGLSYACFGQVCKGLVVLGTVERIRLSFRTLYLDNLACLGQLTEIGDSWPGCYAQ